MSAQIIDRGRGPEIAGTRITVYDIMDYAKHDWSPSSIADWLRLNTDQVVAALRYIKEHQEEVSAEYEEMLKRDEQGNPPEIQAKLDASHAKLMKLMEERRRARQREALDARDNGRS